MYCFDCMNEYEDGEKCPVCGSSRVLNQTENNPSSSLGIKMEIGPDDNYIIGPVEMKRMMLLHIGLMTKLMRNRF